MPPTTDFPLKTIYRISDHRNGNTKQPGVSKQDCLNNYLDVFGPENLTIVADNVRPTTHAFLKTLTDDVHFTSLGNSKSFLFALDLAVSLPDAQPVYLLEDDYLHLSHSKAILLEGLDRADYVTLYDHVDKYMPNSPNPYVKDGGENTKVILTASTHWKFTNSTTMTFAARAHTLKADQDVMTYFCQNDIPKDFQLFLMLTNRKKRSIINPIPGRSTQCDQFLSPLIDWSKVLQRTRS